MGGGGGGVHPQKPQLPESAQGTHNKTTEPDSVLKQPSLTYGFGAFHLVRKQFYMLFGPPPPPFCM